MRIGFISQWFDPESGSAAIPGGIARALSGHGIDVNVITGFPNFPTGQIFPGYHQRFHAKSTMGDLTVHRVPLYPDHSQSSLRRALAYSSFALSSSLVGLPSIGRPDAYVVYSSPVISGVGPTISGRISSTPVLTYVPDLWPDSVMASGIAGHGSASRIIGGSLTRMSRSIYRHSDMVVATSDLMRTTLIERGVDEKRAFTVYNWVDEEVFHPRVDSQEVRESLGVQDKFVAMYAGNLGHLQGVMTFLEAAVLLHQREDITFIFVGSGALEEAMRKEAADRGLRNVTFLGQRTMEETAQLLGAADVQLASLIDTPLLRMTVPSKLQYGMASAKATILAAAGEAADLVTRSRGGIIVPPSDAKALAASIVECADDRGGRVQRMGLNAYSFYQEHLSQAVGSAKLVQLLRKLTGSGSGS
ncbi:MAG: glycosyltransferase family 4 protein [Actinobacteria bacterium]|nr:glycosyltransferase family 4 protein [Actinomycetota bacterium]